MIYVVLLHCQVIGCYSSMTDAVLVQERVGRHSGLCIGTQTPRLAANPSVRGGLTALSVPRGTTVYV